MLYRTLDLHLPVLLLVYLCEQRAGGLAVEDGLFVLGVWVLEEADAVLDEELARGRGALEGELVLDEWKGYCPVPACRRSRTGVQGRVGESTGRMGSVADRGRACVCACQRLHLNHNSPPTRGL